MRIGYQVDYVIVDVYGSSIHYSQKFLTKQFGGDADTVAECREFARWLGENLKNAPCPEPVTVTPIYDSEMN